MPLLISAVVMVQAQNRETINSTRKVAVSFKSLWRRAWQDSVSQQHLTKTTACKTKTNFLVSDRSCPKTNGLKPHHWQNDGQHPHGDVKCWWDMQNLFLYKCCCLSWKRYTGPQLLWSVTGSRMFFLEPHHFRWPWMTSKGWARGSQIFGDIAHIVGLQWPNSS